MLFYRINGSTALSTVPDKYTVIVGNHWFFLFSFYSRSLPHFLKPTKVSGVIRRCPVPVL